MFNLKDLLQQAQGLQSKVAELQEELAAKTVTGSAGGDMVTVEANGAQEILAVRIERGLFEENDPEMIEDLVTAAVNDALAKSRQMMTEEVGKLTGGLRIPGLT